MNQTIDLSGTTKQNEFESRYIAFCRKLGISPRWITRAVSTPTGLNSVRELVIDPEVKTKLEAES